MHMSVHVSMCMSVSGLYTYLPIEMRLWLMVWRECVGSHDKCRSDLVAMIKFSTFGLVIEMDRGVCMCGHKRWVMVYMHKGCLCMDVWDGMSHVSERS